MLLNEAKMIIADKNTKKSLLRAMPEQEDALLEENFNLNVDSDEIVELDVIEQLKSNIHKLKELQARLKFMNDDLQSIIVSRKKR